MIKQKSMPWARLLTIAILTLVVFACRKDLMSTIGKGKVNLEDPELPMDVKLAKLFYSKLKDEKDNKVNMSWYQSGSTDKLMASKELKGNKIINRKHILFQKAYSSQTSRSTFTEIPIVYNQRFSSIIFPDSSYKKATDAIKKEIFAASFDRLIVYKNKLSGKINFHVVTFIPSIKYLRKNDNDISHNHINQLDDDFDGYLEYKDWDDTPLYLVKFNNGKRGEIIPLKKDFNAQLVKKSTSTANKKISSVPPGDVQTNSYTEICNGSWVDIWGTSCVTVDPEGEYVTCTPYLVSSEYVEVCTPVDPCANGGCTTGDPCIDYGYCNYPDPNDPNTPVYYDCAGEPNGSAHMSSCGCIGGSTGIYECPPVPDPDPCDNAKSMTNNATYNEKLTNLSGYVSGTMEHGWYNTKNADGSFSYKSVSGTTANPDMIDYVFTSSVRDIMHNHYTGNGGTNSTFDGGDINAMYTLYNGGNMADIYSFTQTLITSSGTYILTIKDVTKFKAFAPNSIASSIDGLLHITFGYSKTASAASNEIALVRCLAMMNSGLTLLKQNASGKFNILSYTDSQLTTTNCN